MGPFRTRVLRSYVHHNNNFTTFLWNQYVTYITTFSCAVSIFYVIREHVIYYHYQYCYYYLLYLHSSCYLWFSIKSLRSKFLHFFRTLLSILAGFLLPSNLLGLNSSLDNQYPFLSAASTLSLRLLLRLVSLSSYLNNSSLDNQYPFLSAASTLSLRLLLRLVSLSSYLNNFFFSGKSHIFIWIFALILWSAVIEKFVTWWVSFFYFWWLKWIWSFARDSIIRLYLKMPPPCKCVYNSLTQSPAAW